MEGGRKKERKGRGREGKVSRKATGSVSGFFNLWKTCRCLKGGWEGSVGRWESQDDGQDREGIGSGSQVKGHPREFTLHPLALWGGDSSLLSACGKCLKKNYGAHLLTSVPSATFFSSLSENFFISHRDESFVCHYYYVFPLYKNWDWGR